MSRKAPYRLNSAGLWIDSKTGRFAKKSDYLPFAKKLSEAKAAKSEKLRKASKAYWKDVKDLQRILGLDVKEARKKLYNSPKYVQKRGHIPKQWADFWKEAKKGNMSKAQRADYKKRLEEDDIELISF